MIESLGTEYQSQLESLPQVNCNNQRKLVSGGFYKGFKSPFYPEAAPKGSSCLWRFVIQANSTVTIMCSTVDVPCNSRAKFFMLLRGKEDHSECTDEPLENQKFDLPASSTRYSLAIGFQAGNDSNSRLECIVRAAGGKSAGKGNNNPRSRKTIKGDFSSPGCGTLDSRRKRRESKMEKYIMGGKVSLAGSWPWAVKVVTPGGFCGGTLISTETVLTAAHCIDGSSRATLQFDCKGVRCKTRYAKSILVHPRYRFPFADVALVKIRFLVSGSSSLNLTPACLPPLGKGQPPSGTEVIAIGWGRTSAKSGPSGFLKEAKMKLVQMSACSNFYVGNGAERLKTSQCAIATTGSTCPVRISYIQKTAYSFT